jgi:hypothetical protein
VLMGPGLALRAIPGMGELTGFPRGLNCRNNRLA